MSVPATPPVPPELRAAWRAPVAAAYARLPAWAQTPVWSAIGLIPRSVQRRSAAAAVALGGIHGYHALLRALEEERTPDDRRLTDAAVAAVHLLVRDRWPDRRRLLRWYGRCPNLTDRDLYELTLHWGSLEERAQRLWTWLQEGDDRLGAAAARLLATPPLWHVVDHLVCDTLSELIECRPRPVWWPLYERLLAE